MGANSGKVLVIGLDGVSWELLDPMIDAGILPFFASLRKEGATGALCSTLPPATAPAWATFMTGKNPGKHGIFDLTLLKDHTIQELPVDTTRLKGQRIWDLLTEAGLDSIVLNVPVTWPPLPLKGILFSDFLTPKSENRISWPEEIQDEIESQFGPFRLYFNQVYTPRNIGNVLDEAFENLEYRFKTARYLIKNNPWNLALVHCFGTDRLQHELFHLLDPKHPAYREQESREYKKRFEGYFSELDRLCCELKDLAGEDASFIIMSDHGMGPVHDYLVFNVWLSENGFLRFRRSPAVSLKKLLYNAGLTPCTCYRIASITGFSNLRQSTGIGTRYRFLNSIGKIFLSMDDLDWKRTRAYSKGNYGQIYINLKGRQPEGIVSPGDEYLEIRDEIAEKLRELKNPVSGERIDLEIFYKEEIYQGPYLDQAPDIFFLPRDMRYKALGTMDFISNKFFLKNFAQSGDHKMFGILAAAGPLFREAIAVKNAGIADLAPTILHLLGQNIPRDMDGRPLTEIMSEDFLNGNPPAYSLPSGQSSEANNLFSEEDVEEIKNRLKGMGYLG